MLDKLVMLSIFSQHKVFPLPGWYFPIQLDRFSQRSLDCTTSRSDNLQLVQSQFITHRKRSVEVDFVDEELLQEEDKQKWLLNVDYGMEQKLEDIP